MKLHRLPIGSWFKLMEDVPYPLSCGDRPRKHKYYRLVDANPKDMWCSCKDTNNFTALIPSYVEIDQV